MIVREDADIGSLLLGDVHRKSKALQLRLRDAIEVLTYVRTTGLNMLYSGLGLQDPTDDIADDVPLMRTLVGEFPKPLQPAEVHTPRGFVTEVQVAMHAEEVQCSQRPASTAPVELGESDKDTPDSPMKSMSSPAPLSPDGLLCSMHSQSPCTPTDLKRGSTKGPWFHRTPALTMTTATSGVSATRKLELPLPPTDVGTNSLSSTHRQVSKDVSCVSEVLQQRANNKVSSTPVDDGQDDVISRTTLKSDGR
jgi:hypothetical protein